MKKTNKKMNNSVTVCFPYVISKFDEDVENGMIQEEVSEDELQEVANIMSQHGGYPVDMCECGDLTDRLYDILYINELERLFPDEDDYSVFQVELCDDMPRELVEAADKYVQFKDVDQDFYLDVDGQEVKSSFLLQISNRSFNKMKDIVTSGPHDQSDFDMLKQHEPEAYAEVTELIFEWAFKYSMREYGVGMPCILKDFPFQVYENV